MSIEKFVMPAKVIENIFNKVIVQKTLNQGEEKIPDTRNQTDISSK